jgi:hypothetical protein
MLLVIADSLKNIGNLGTRQVSGGAHPKKIRGDIPLFIYGSILAVFKITLKFVPPQGFKC